MKRPKKVKLTCKQKHALRRKELGLLGRLVRIATENVPSFKGKD